MFEALKQRLKDVQDFDQALEDAAIAVATEQRMKVREGQRQVSRIRRDKRRELRSSGFTAKETRARLGKRRKGSGISIEAQVSGLDVRLVASDQVMHLRREQDETIDIMAAYRKHLSVGQAWRKRTGRA